MATGGRRRRQRQLPRLDVLTRSTLLFSPFCLSDVANAFGMSRPAVVFTLTLIARHARPIGA